LRTFKPSIVALVTTALLNACSSDSSPVQYVQIEDRLVLEVETWSDSALASQTSWSPTTDTSGDLVANVVHKVSAEQTDLTVPYLTFDLNFTEAGEYYFWMRGKNSSTETASVAISFTNNSGASTYTMDAFNDQWEWLQTDADSQRIAINVEEAGPYQLQLASASTGLSLDKIVLTRRGDYIPEGQGPDSTLSGDASALTELNDDEGVSEENNNSSDTSTAATTNNTSDELVTPDVDVRFVDSVNQAPVLRIDALTQIAVAQPLSLKAVAMDDNRPATSIYYYWTQLSGPADATLSAIQSANITATFPEAGNYTLQVNAHDGQTYTNAVTSVLVSEAQPVQPVNSLQTATELQPAGNQAPVILPVSPAITSANSDTTLSASATDDGLPNNVIYYYWTKSGGPGDVIFSAQNQAKITARFTQPGNYVLQVNANDGERYSNQQVIVTVNAASPGVTTITTENNTTDAGQQTPVVESQQAPVVVSQQETRETFENDRSINVDNKWKNLNFSGKPTKRHETGGVVVNGKLYMIGGRKSLPVDVYDPKSNRWSSLGKTPFEMHHFQPVAIGSKIYIVGGFTGRYPRETPIADVHIFDTKNGKWSKGGSIPSKRRRGSAGAAVYKGKIYLLGGNTKGHSGGAVSWFDEFDPSTGKWKTLASAPDSRDHVSIALVGNKLVAAGGRRSAYPDTFGNTVSQTNVYDFNSNKWQRTSSIPTKRAGAMTVKVGNEVLILGGESKSGKDAHDEVEAYNVNTKKWRKLKPMLTGRHSGVAAILNGAVHVVAGATGQGGRGETNSHHVLK